MTREVDTYPRRALEKANGPRLSRNRKELGALLLLCSFAIFTWLPRLSGPIDLRFDGGAYYILGISLAEGKGYRLLNEPGDIQTVLHPPLLPAIVALHSWALGASDFVVVGYWLRISFFLLFIAYTLAVYKMLRIYLTLGYAFLATLLFLLHYNTLFMSDLLYTEIPYGFVTTLFVICHHRSRKREYAILSALLAVALYTLRAAGVAMFAAWVGESLLRREFKKALLRAAIALVPILCWQSYIAAVEGSPQYQHPAYEYQRADYMYPNVTYAKFIFRLKDSFKPELGRPSLMDVANRFASNSIKIPSRLGEVVSSNEGYWIMIWDELDARLVPFPPVSQPVIRCAVTVIGLLILGGVCLQLLRRQWIIPLYVLLSVALICLTPWPDQFLRYLLPLTPLLLLSLFILLTSLERQLRRLLPAELKFSAPILPYALGSLMLILEIATVPHMYRDRHTEVVYEGRNGGTVRYRLFYYDDFQALNAGLDWLKDQGRPGEIVAARELTWVYLRTGLKTVLPPFELDAGKAQYLLDTVPATYLIRDKSDFDTKKYIEALLESRHNEWERVFSTPDGNVEIYRRAGHSRP